MLLPFVDCLICAISRRCISLCAVSIQSERLGGCQGPGRLRSTRPAFCPSGAFVAPQPLLTAGCCERCDHAACSCWAGLSWRAHMSAHVSFAVLDQQGCKPHPRVLVCAQVAKQSRPAEKSEKSTLRSAGQPLLDWGSTHGPHSRRQPCVDGVPRQAKPLLAKWPPSLPTPSPEPQTPLATCSTMPWSCQAGAPRPRSTLLLF